VIFLIDNRGVSSKGAVEGKIIIKFQQNKDNFEIIADCDKALELKKGKDIPISDILAVNEIFSDVHSGDRASKEDLIRVFKTDIIEDIAKKIIEKGSIPLTMDYKNKKVEEKRKEILQKIQRESVDSRTNLPIPMQRLENAFKQANIKITFEKNTDEQIKDIILKLAVYLPLKFEKKKLEITVPAQYSGAVCSFLKSKYDVIKDNWQNSGAYNCIVQVTPGDLEKVTNFIEEKTKGTAEIKYME